MDTGGVLVTCPMCNGEGTIVPLEKKLDELKKNNEEPKSEIKNEIQKTKENNSRDERTIDFVDEERKSKLVGKKLQGKKGR